MCKDIIKYVLQFQVLLKEGAGLEQTDRLGRTPLMVAAAEGHTGVLELLLQVGKHVHTIRYLPQLHHFDTFQLKTKYNHDY